METDSENQLAQDIERELYERHGATLGGLLLYRALGFPTVAAMRQAVSRGRMPVSVRHRRSLRAVRTNARSRTLAGPQDWRPELVSQRNARRDGLAYEVAL